MAALELRFLGTLEVLRDGESVTLPPSRKTRALLAYLALNARSFSREHLCELLWEIPDDPRGSLRWSLSKLRRVVDDDDRQRIIADRLTVGFDASDVAIDIAALKALTDSGLEQASLESLETAAARYRGDPLEGLDLPNFHDFEAWCVIERESVTRAQTRLLTTLVRRLPDDPARALPHAQALVRIAPYDEGLRAALIRLLAAVGRHDQARQQYQAGIRLLKEAGIVPGGELARAWRSAPVRTAAIERSPIAAPRAPEPASTPAGATSEPLVGRDVEIEQLTQALSYVVSQGRCALRLLVGEPGIGKSRLLAAAATRARESGVLLLEAAAYESESIRPFAVWIDALRKLESDVSPAVFGKGDHANRDRLFGALSDLVTEKARSQPVALVFDDLHWGDESTAAALHYVVRTNADRPLLGVLAAREDELRDNAPMARALRDLRTAGLLEVIPVGPLGADALRALIDARSPQAHSERLSRACGGNPLLAIELARAEAAGDSGQSLGELVQERLARFDVEGGEVLRWAAVLAPRIDAATLARITGLDWNRIGEVLETAARQSMLVPSGRGLSFSHDLIARSIYAGISPARRRTMHRRIADALEHDTALDLERAADLAHHAAQSGDAALAARAMISAGKLCLRFFANDEAMTLARKGLQWVADLPEAERVCLTLELREIMLSAGPLEDWEAAALEYAALAERALDHGALSHARRGYYMASYVRWMHGHTSGAREEILQSERVTRGAGEEEHIVGMAEAARCLALLERDLTHADAMLMEARALASRRHVDHHAIPAALGMLRFHEGRFDEAVELFKEARTLSRSCGDRLSEFQANEYLAMIDIERGRHESAKERCVALIELGEKLREGSERPLAHALDALCHYAIADDAVPLETALVDLRTADAKHRLAYTLTRAALLDVERGRPDEAISHAGEALGYAEALDRPSEIMLAHVALARARLAANDMAGSARHAAAIAELERGPVAGWARERATALWRSHE
jgi:DNA-binding SARP family transcriptional activator/tetratricopeptide (TPR) repeat protein